MARSKAKGTSETATSSERSSNPVWFAPVIIGLLLLGLLWILVYYISGTAYPVQQLGNFNLLIGIGISFVGLLMATRWR